MPPFRSGVKLWRHQTIKRNLLGGLEHFIFSRILGIIIPTDFHNFQRGGSTTNQKCWPLKSLASQTLGSEAVQMLEAYAALNVRHRAASDVTM